MENNKYIHRNQLLSWLTVDLSKKTLMGEDKFSSITEETQVQCFLYHPDMAIIRPIIKENSGCGSKKNSFSVKDIYGLEIFEKYSVFMPKILNDNKNKRSTWYKYEVEDVDFTERKDGVTPLALACYHGMPDVVAILLSVLNHPPNVKSNDGTTPMMETIAGSTVGEDNVEQRVRCLQQLLKYGASGIMQHRTGHNAITLSCYTGVKSYLKQLESSMAKLNWNHQTKLGHTPLMFAVYSENVDLIAYLVNDKIIDPCKENYLHLTALDLSLLLDLKSEIKGLLAVQFSHSGKLKEHIQKKLSLLQHQEKEFFTIKKDQIVPVFVSFLLTTLYLGRFKQVRQVILEAGIIDFLYDHLLWKDMSMHVKTEYCLYIAAFLFFDNDKEGMSQLIKSKWAELQFEYENSKIENSSMYTLDRFSGILAFFMFASNGYEWLNEKFLKYPKLASAYARYDFNKDAFVLGFHEEILKIVAEFNIEAGFTFYNAKTIHPAIRKYEMERKKLKMRIIELLPVRNKIIQFLTNMGTNEIMQITKPKQTKGNSQKKMKAVKGKTKKVSSVSVHATKQEVPSFDTDCGLINSFIKNSVYDTTLSKKELRKLKKKAKSYIYNQSKLEETNENNSLDLKEPTSENNCFENELRVNLDISKRNEPILNQENHTPEEELQEKQNKPEDTSILEDFKQENLEIIEKTDSLSTKLLPQLVIVETTINSRVENQKSTFDKQETENMNISNDHQNDYSSNKREFCSIEVKKIKDCKNNVIEKCKKPDGFDTKSQNKILNDEKICSEKTDITINSTPTVANCITKENENCKQDIKEQLNESTPFNINNQYYGHDQTDKEADVTNEGRYKKFSSPAAESFFQDPAIVQMGIPFNKNITLNKDFQKENFLEKCKPLAKINDVSYSDDNVFSNGQDSKENFLNNKETSENVPYQNTFPSAAHDPIPSILLDYLSPCKPSKNNNKLSNLKVRDDKVFALSNTDNQPPSSTTSDADITTQLTAKDKLASLTTSDTKMSSKLKVKDKLASLMTNERKTSTQLNAKGKLASLMSNETKMSTQFNAKDKLTNFMTNEAKMLTQFNANDKLTSLMSNETKMSTQFNANDKLTSLITNETKLSTQFNVKDKLTNFMTNETTMSTQLIADDKLAILKANERKMSTQSNVNDKLPCLKSSDADMSMHLNACNELTSLTASDAVMSTHSNANKKLANVTATDADTSVNANNKLPCLMTSDAKISTHLNANNKLQNLITTDADMLSHSNANDKLPSLMTNDQELSPQLNATSQHSNLKIYDEKVFPHLNQNNQCLSLKTTYEKQLKSENLSKKRPVREEVHVPLFFKQWGPVKSVRWRNMLKKLASTSPAQIYRAGTINFLNNMDYIAKGSFNTVVRAGIRDDGTEVAVKCMLKTHKNSIVNEYIKNLRELRHPNIIQYKDYIEDDDYAYLALELCESTLDEYVYALVEINQLKHHHRRLCYQFMCGLNALHNVNLAHKNIKPSNILIDVKGDARLANFGLSTQLTIEQDVINHNTKYWRAPEIIKMASSIKRDWFKPSADIYAAALILYYIMTGGTYPFGGDIAICESKKLKGHLPNIDHLRNDLFSDLFHAMTYQNRDKRISSEVCKGHPFFWDSKRKFHFLVCVARNRDIGARVSNELLDKIYSLLPAHPCTANWAQNLDPSIVQFMSWEGVHANNVLDIITVIIPELDERSHCKEESSTFKKYFKEGASNFIFKNYPGLFMIVYKAVLQAGWKTKQGIRDFYQFSNEHLM